jgi:F0F1-type ATP synthase assembly protein I
MDMKETVLRLIFIQLAVLVLSLVGGFALWSAGGLVAAPVGVLAFSLPLSAFSLLVLRASAGAKERFWGRFMTAELLKWVSAAVLLALAFLSKAFAPQPLLAGFFLSVLVQVFFPIFVPKASES